jgi:hypothetical protein
MLNFNQRQMYGGLLTSIHGRKSEPFGVEPQAPAIATGRANKRAPPLPAGLQIKVSAADSYLAGAAALAGVEEVDFECLWLLLLW